MLCTRLASRTASFLFYVFIIYSQCNCTFSKQTQQREQSKPDSTQTVRQRLTRDALLPCKSAIGNADGLEQILWWYRAVGDQLIGTFNTSTRTTHQDWSREGAYAIANNGTLLVVRSVRRELVERYECVGKYAKGNESRDVVFLRLDFSSWYALEPFSLFFGSLIAAAVFCAASFILNILWIIVRWAVLKAIRRSERLSRVRSLLVAMEKYGQRQMESIHEGYSRRVSNIRENYHNQMDALRHSYAESADRFRDYRQAQMDNVQQHLDGYYAQITRLREYGSRRVEQIWESYDRSISAVRTFTLEQRLRVLNHYKVKQRYVNKLLEALATETDGDVISKKEAAIREVLGEEEPPPPVWPCPHPANGSRGTSPQGGGNLIAIPRSASYYSLPEFVIDGDNMNMGGPDEKEMGNTQQHASTVPMEHELSQQPSTSGSSNCTRITRVQFAE